MDQMSKSENESIKEEIRSIRINRTYRVFLMLYKLKVHHGELPGKHEMRNFMNKFPILKRHINNWRNNNVK